MDQITVLGVLQAEQRAVGREPAAARAMLVDATDANGVGRSIHLSCSASRKRDVDGESAEVADSRRDDPGRLRETLVPACGYALQERLRLAPRERLHDPAARLIAGLVLEPEDSFRVNRQRSVDHADSAVGHLTTLARRRLPRIQLPDAR